MNEFTLQRFRNKRLLRNHDTLIQWVQHFLNIAVICTVLPLLAYLKAGEVSPTHRTIIVIAVLLVTIIYHLMGVFRQHKDLFSGIQQLARAWGVVIIVLAWVSYITGLSETYSRSLIVNWIFTTFVTQAFILLITSRWYRYYRKHYAHRIPALIIGVGDLASHLASSIRNNIWMNDDVVGVLRYKGESNEWHHQNIPELGNSEDLVAVVEAKAIRRVYLALPLAQCHMVKELQDALSKLNLDIVWVPDIFELQLVNHSVRELAGIPLININETPLMAGGPAFIKSCMDKSAAAVLIVILSPVLLACAIAVKLSSSGPIIFKQVRDGWDGRKFHVYKFRSMHVHKEEGLVKQAQKNDSRVTTVGKFLRKTSLDELPQLFNVLEGTMSLVGPRPHAVSHNTYYSDKVKAYLTRHRLKPGITGLAQINGFRGETQTLEDMANRVEHDLEYIRNWSPWLDLKILLLTPGSLLRKSENAY